MAKVSGPRQDMSGEIAYVDFPEECLFEKSLVLRNALTLCVERRVEEALVVRQVDSRLRAIGL